MFDTSLEIYLTEICRSHGYNVQFMLMFFAYRAVFIALLKSVGNLHWRLVFAKRFESNLLRRKIPMGENHKEHFAEQRIRMISVMVTNFLQRRAHHCKINCLYRIFTGVWKFWPHLNRYKKYTLFLNAAHRKVKHFVTFYEQRKCEPSKTSTCIDL